MDRQITITYNDWTATISVHGAELLSLVKKGREFIYDGDARWWVRRAPILFPNAGGLIDETYYYGTESYPCPKHGFAKDKDFDPILVDEKKVTLELKEDKETLLAFPFRFALQVTFELSGRGLKIEYRVINKDVRPFYFSIGAHEGYHLDKPLDQYSIVFEKDEALESVVLDGKLLSHQKLDLTSFGNKLPMKDEYFAVDALVFEHIASRKVSLVEKEEGTILSVRFPNASNLLLWTKIGAPYLCIEPWSSTPDYNDCEKDISKKPDVIYLEPGKDYVFAHEIEVE